MLNTKIIDSNYSKYDIFSSEIYLYDLESIVYSLPFPNCSCCRICGLKHQKQNFILGKKKSRNNLPGLFCDTLCLRTFQLKDFQTVSSLVGSVILRHVIIISFSSVSLMCVLLSFVTYIIDQDLFIR